jgi:hypothetical protein
MENIDHIEFNSLPISKKLEILRNIFGNVCCPKISEICDSIFKIEEIANGELFYYYLPSRLSHYYTVPTILVGYFLFPSYQDEDEDIKYYWFLDVVEQETPYPKFKYISETNYDELFNKMRPDLQILMNDMYLTYVSK